MNMGTGARLREDCVDGESVLIGRKERVEKEECVCFVHERGVCAFGVCCTVQSKPKSTVIVTELYNVKLVCNVETGVIKACCLNAVQFCGLE